MSPDLTPPLASPDPDLTPEQVRRVLSEITPGEWEGHVQPDGSLIITAPRKPAPGELLQEIDTPVWLIASEVGSRNAALIALLPSLASAYLSEHARAEAAEAREEEKAALHLKAAEEAGRLREALEGATADMLTAGRQIEVDMGSLCAVMDVDEEPVSRTIENAQFLRSQAVLARVVLAEAEGGEK